MITQFRDLIFFPLNTKFVIFIKKVPQRGGQKSLQFQKKANFSRLEILFTTNYNSLYLNLRVTTSRLGYFSSIHKIILLIYLRRSGVFHFFQIRCTESEKETEIVILIYLRFLIKHVYYHLIDYQPFYYDLGLISKIPCDTNFIIGHIFTLLP